MKLKKEKIYVAGHCGMVGSAIVRCLRKRGYANILTRSRSDLNLIDQKAVQSFIYQEKPDYIFNAAGKVGSMYDISSHPADFIYENLVIEANLIHGAHLANVSHLFSMSSNTVYPHDCPQPMKEEYLLTGSLHPSVAPYALAKIAGITLCESYNRQYDRTYTSIVCPNLYGVNDNFDPLVSNVMPSLIRKLYEAKKSGARSMAIWGSGKSRREFLFTEDLADACIFLMETRFSGGMLNIGPGTDVAIYELVDIIKKIVGYNGEIVFDTSKPDGAPHKSMDISRLKNLGWQAQTNLLTGICLVLENAPFTTNGDLKGYYEV